MPVIKSPKPIDKNKFSRTLNDPEYIMDYQKMLSFAQNVRTVIKNQTLKKNIDIFLKLKTDPKF